MTSLQAFLTSEVKASEIDAFVQKHIVTIILAGSAGATIDRFAWIFFLGEWFHVVAMLVCCVLVGALSISLTCCLSVGIIRRVVTETPSAWIYWGSVITLRCLDFYSTSHFGVFFNCVSFFYNAVVAHIYFLVPLTDALPRRISKFTGRAGCLVVVLAQGVSAVLWYSNPALFQNFTSKTWSLKDGDSDRFFQIFSTFDLSASCQIMVVCLAAEISVSLFRNPHQAAALHDRILLSELSLSSTFCNDPEPLGCSLFGSNFGSMTCMIWFQNNGKWLLAWAIVVGAVEYFVQVLFSVSFPQLLSAIRVLCGVSFLSVSIPVILSMRRSVLKKLLRLPEVWYYMISIVLIGIFRMLIWGFSTPRLVYYIGFLTTMTIFPLVDSIPAGDNRGLIGKVGAPITAFFQAVNFSFVKVNTATTHSQYSVPEFFVKGTVVVSSLEVFAKALLILACVCFYVASAIWLAPEKTVLLKKPVELSSLHMNHEIASKVPSRVYAAIIYDIDDHPEDLS